MAVWGCRSPAPAAGQRLLRGAARGRASRWPGKSRDTNASSAGETWHPCVPGRCLQPFHQLQFSPQYVFWQVAGSLEQWSMTSGCCRGCHGLKAAGAHFSLAQMPVTAIDLSWGFELDFSPGPAPSRTTQPAPVAAGFYWGEVAMHTPREIWWSPAQHER